MQDTLGLLLRMSGAHNCKFGLVLLRPALHPKVQVNIEKVHVEITIELLWLYRMCGAAICMLSYSDCTIMSCVYF